MRRLLFLLSLFALVLDTNATSKDSLQILSEARQAIAKHAAVKNKRLSARVQSDSIRILENRRQFVIAGYTDGGFALISKDDAFPSLWGYSDSQYKTGEHSPAFLAMLDAIDSILNVQPSGMEMITAASLDKEVQPLVSTKWNQHEPFNRCCPEIDGQRTVTGCVPTALAQLLHYFRLPTEGSGTYTYEFRDDYWNRHTNSIDFSEYTFNHDLMLDEYPITWDYDNEKWICETDDESANEVAKLMYACGSACSADYGLYGTSAKIDGGCCYDIKKFLGVELEYVDFTHIKDYLDFGFPFILYGLPDIDSKFGSSHEMLVDGYDKQGLFHVNFGWGGIDDGYYPITKFGDFVPNQWNIFSLHGGDCAASFVSIDGIRYNINSIGQATVCGFDGNPTHVEIPSSFIYNGHTCNVERISISDKQIRDLILPSSILDLGLWECDIDHLTINSPVSIGGYGIRKSTLESITIKCEELPKCGNDSFWETDMSNISLFVPQNQLDEYRDLAPWNKFGAIYYIGQDTPPVEDIEQDGIRYHLSSSVKAKIIGYNNLSNDAEVVIPSVINYDNYEYTINNIEAGAFHKAECKSIDLGATAIKRICRSGFRESIVEDVILPHELSSIDESAFKFCYNLKSIVIPKSTTILRDSVFYGCDKLVNIHIYSNNFSDKVYGSTFHSDPHYAEPKHMYLYSATVLDDIDIQAFVDYRRGVFSDLSTYTLHVPSDLIDAYKAHSVWGQFGTIVALTEEELQSGIRLPDSNKNATPAIYDLQGRPLRQLPSRGIYIKEGKKTIGVL